jgi:hypothetical protein
MLSAVRSSCVGSWIPVPVCLLLTLQSTSCCQCPILVGCPAEPYSWRSYTLACACFTKKPVILSYMRLPKRQVGHGPWYSSGVHYARRSQVLSPTCSSPSVETIMLRKLELEGLVHLVSPSGSPEYISSSYGLLTGRYLHFSRLGNHLSFRVNTDRMGSHH